MFLCKYTQATYTRITSFMAVAWHLDDFLFNKLNFLFRQHHVYELSMWTGKQGRLFMCICILFDFRII